MFRSAFTNTFRSPRVAEVARTFVGCANKNQSSKLIQKFVLMKTRNCESLASVKLIVVPIRYFTAFPSEPEIGNQRMRGVLKYPNGFVYEGEMAGGQPHGQGKITLRDGKVFEGEFVNGVLQGQPRTLTTLWYHYEGDVFNGVPHGQGKMTMKNGEVRKGEFCESVLVGHGKILYPDGVMYEGDCKNNVKDGFGVVLYPCGGRLEGRFVDDCYDGIVKRFHPNGQRIETYYVRGKEEGVERLIRPDGSVEEGTYLAVTMHRPFPSKPHVSKHYFSHGQVKYIHPSGLVEEGEMMYDMRVGRWKYTHPNGVTTTEEIPSTILQKFKIAFVRYILWVGANRYRNPAMGFCTGCLISYLMFWV